MFSVSCHKLQFKCSSSGMIATFKHIMLPHSTVVEIGFDPTNYTVNEDNGTVILLVCKRGENEIPVTVDISTFAGTAEGMHRLCTRDSFSFT